MLPLEVRGSPTSWENGLPAVLHFFDQRLSQVWWEMVTPLLISSEPGNAGSPCDGQRKMRGGEGKKQVGGEVIFQNKSVNLPGVHRHPLLSLPASPGFSQYERLYNSFSDKRKQQQQSTYSRSLSSRVIDCHLD